MSRQFLIKPQFLTNKMKLIPLSATKNVYDFQLPEHFLTKTHLNILQCACLSHKHNKQSCIIVTEPACVKCKTPTKQLISYQSLMYHNNLLKKKLTKCCKHVHSPPCNRCINCQIGQTCIIAEPFECYESTGECEKIKNPYNTNAHTHSLFCEIFFLHLQYVRVVIKIVV
ncbi:OrNV gp098-like protein [Tomelloso virus]|uniref:OrNV gp098-like protein n=1 Tax=Tomelloso virus TaxID=2053981 RepID=A0A2H4T2Y8_9VIRU|nr:OrNV gp098-like protein [Tomelloso virus]ATY70249.1 OrNV gp098-like protein [Tomelloso virus]